MKAPGYISNYKSCMFSYIYVYVFNKCFYILDVAKLKIACTKKTLSNSSLEFEEIDPPRYIIASSEDKLTESDFKDYLTKKKKQEVVKVHTTEEGPITAKLKERSGITLRSLYYVNISIVY